MKKALKAIWQWIRPRLAKLFTLTIENVAKDILEIINDPEIQTLAYDSVKAVAEQGFKDNEAFETAKTALKTKLKAYGYNFSNTILDTLIQNAYIVFKYQN